MKFIDIIKENNNEGENLGGECEKKIKTAKNVLQIFKNGEIVHPVDGSVLKYEFTGHAKYRCDKREDIDNPNSNKIVAYALIETHHGITFPFDVYVDNVKKDVNTYDLGSKRQLFYKICDDMSYKFRKFNINLKSQMH